MSPVSPVRQRAGVGRASVLLGPGAPWVGRACGCRRRSAKALTLDVDVCLALQAVKHEDKSRMGVANLCKVFAASLLRHPDDMTTVLRLPFCPRPSPTALFLYRAHHAAPVDCAPAAPAATAFHHGRVHAGGARVAALVHPNKMVRWRHGAARTADARGLACAPAVSCGRR